jgi:hypothetical protein
LLAPLPAHFGPAERGDEVGGFLPQASLVFGEGAGLFGE